ncbi:MAG: hypothetical protein JSW39_06550 [Desulfobacterales bacterium]|nr:MAG: hypothetical protein JSW39_06550 [Desulfobacterales bacterium]
MNQPHNHSAARLPAGGAAQKYIRTVTLFGLLTDLLVVVHVEPLEMDGHPFAALLAHQYMGWKVI